jgi:hypothetical protein
MNKVFSMLVIMIFSIILMLFGATVMDGLIRTRHYSPSFFELEFAGMPLYLLCILGMVFLNAKSILDYSRHMVRSRFDPFQPGGRIDVEIPIHAGKLIAENLLIITIILGIYALARGSGLF